VRSGGSAKRWVRGRLLSTTGGQMSAVRGAGPRRPCLSVSWLWWVARARCADGGALRALLRLRSGRAARVEGTRGGAGGGGQGHARHTRSHRDRCNQQVG
jgi:hypothetical protein